MDETTAVQTVVASGVSIQIIVGVIVAVVAQMITALVSFALGKAFSDGKINKIDTRLHDIEKTLVQIQMHSDEIESSRMNIREIYQIMDVLRDRIAKVEGATGR